MKIPNLFILATLICLMIPAAKAGNDVERFLSKAKELIKSDVDLAEDYIEKARKLEPNNPEVAFICGRIMGKQAENSTFFALSYAGKALACLKDAVKNAPEKIVYRKGLLNFYLGAPSIAGGDTELALQQVHKITELDRLQGALAEIKYLRDTEQAELLLRRFKAFSRDFPNDSEIHFKYGLHLQEQKQYQKAYSVFVIASSINGSNSQNLNTLYQLGRNAVFSELHTQRGIDSLNLFIVNFEKDNGLPPLEWGHYRIAQLYELVGNKKMIQFHLKEARKSNDQQLLELIDKEFQ